MSKPFSIIIIELGDDATKRLEFWRHTLLKISSDAISGVSEGDTFGQELRGAAAVAALAEMERLLREALVELSIDINSASVPIRDLSPGLRPLAAESYFQALNTNSKGDKHWDNRALVTQLEKNITIAKFPSRTISSPQPPLDGKTIRSAHFRRIWDVLGLEGEAIPKGEMETSLNALSTIRNDVAHGNIPISEIFHRQVTGKTADAMAHHIQNLILLVDHFCLSLSSYAVERRYKSDA